MNMQLYNKTLSVRPSMPQPGQHPSKFQATVNRMMAEVDSYIVRGQRFVQEFIARAGKPVDTLFKVAQQRIDQGEYEDAASRLRMVIKFQPAHPQAWYLLGVCCLELEDGQEEAVQAFKKALALNPSNEEARFLLCVTDPHALPPEKQPKFAPLSLATMHFDDMAYDYDSFQLDDMRYRGHEELARSVRKFLNPNYKKFQILDLGCGTGLLGRQFTDIAGRIEGVDISRAMGEQAESLRDFNERAIYEKVSYADLRHFLLEYPESSVELVLAANVFPFLGGLTPVFDGAARVLKPGGLFGFSFLPITDQEFGLIPGEGQFGHSRDYIEQQAQRVGLEIADMHAFEIYPEAEAVLGVLRKPAPAQTQTPQTPPPNPAVPPSPQS